jgi:hypothetical protein
MSVVVGGIKGRKDGGEKKMKKSVDKGGDNILK